VEQKTAVAGNLPRRGGKFPASGLKRGWYRCESRPVLSLCVVAGLHRYVRDSEVVAAIVAGDPGGLAEAYDKYAAPLYAYCRSLLREPADAADVVQDTFVIAASRLAGLRDQNRLRPWLYAVARNECYRRRRATAANPTADLDTMPDVTDATADVGGEASRAELRALLRSAVRGLNASDQDLIELQIRQGLDVAEIAALLGVSRNHAHALLSRARDQLETSLGALLVARTGRDDCAALSAMLEGWDGQLTVLMRKRLNRHIERCPVCGERKRRELAPALLLGLAPLAALPIAAMPAGMRAAVLKLASSDTPEAVAHRAIVAQRATLFGHTGFPRPLGAPKTPWWRTRQGQVTAGGVAAAAVAATVIGVALAGGGPGHHAGQAAFAQGPAPSSTGAVSGSAPSQRPHPTVTAGGVGPGSSGAGVGGPPSPTAAGSAGAVAPSGSGSGSSSPSASRSAVSSAPASPRPTPSPEQSSGTTKGANSPAASASTTPPPSSSSSSSAPPPPSASGTLGVSPTSILLSVGGSASLTLTASNGPVNWSITESQGLIGGLTVSPSSGTLASGSSTTVSVTASDLLTVGGQLTVQPGGITVSVVLSLNLGAPALGPGGSSGPGLAGLPARRGAW
jgi:RNA polymerase sigma factor (sigma-70 family)